MEYNFQAEIPKQTAQQLAWGRRSPAQVFEMLAAFSATRAKERPASFCQKAVRVNDVQREPGGHLISFVIY